MKTKLLREVRKRFEIIHMPDGFISSDGDHSDYNLYKLIDYKGFDRYAQKGHKLNGGQFSFNVFETDRECIDFLLGEIISKLRQEGYRQRKDRVIKTKYKKVWHI